MASDKMNFTEYLACYGSEVSTWPQEAQRFARRVLPQAEFAAMLEKERRFEQLLREDILEPMPSDLTRRVIAVALAGRAEPAPKEVLHASFITARAALAAMLMLGFAVGYGAFTPATHGEEEALLQSYSSDEEATL